MGRSCRICLLVSDKEKLLVITLAHLEGDISLAALIRLLVYRAAYQSGVLVEKLDFSEEGPTAKPDLRLGLTGGQV